MSAQRTDGLRERWMPGESAWFEYHCLESHDSADADLWYRSHQLVTVGAMELNDSSEGDTLDDRIDAACPRTYTVTFRDGSTGCATEDDLLTGPAHFYRPDPPKVNETRA